MHPSASKPAPSPRRAAPPAAPAAPIKREYLRAEIRAHPAVPEDPARHVRHWPSTPSPAALDPRERPATHREHLIELYVSACKVYWPGSTVGRAVKYLRTRLGQDMLNQSIETFMALGLQPAVWVRFDFDRQKRRSPLRPEILFDPVRIERCAVHAREHSTELFQKVPHRSADYRVFREGLTMLHALYQRTLEQLLNLPEPSSDFTIRRTVQTFFPEDGWREVYDKADKRIRAIERELNERVERGTFIWTRGRAIAEEA